MRTLLLEMNLGNDANDCCMNIALIGELWACYMDNIFSWEMLGTWKELLIRLLDRGPSLLWFIDLSCLGILLDGWFASYAKGAQHDGVEFLGWLSSLCIVRFSRRLCRHLAGRFVLKPR